MSLAGNQREKGASAVSPSAVVNGLLLARLHPNANYGARTRKGVCLSRRAKSILWNQTARRGWDFNHRNKARNSHFFFLSRAHNISAAHKGARHERNNLVNYEAYL